MVDRTPADPHPHCGSKRIQRRPQDEVLPNAETANARWKRILGEPRTHHHERTQCRREGTVDADRCALYFLVELRRGWAPPEDRRRPAAWHHAPGAPHVAELRAVQPAMDWLHAMQPRNLTDRPTRQPAGLLACDHPARCFGEVSLQVLTLDDRIQEAMLQQKLRALEALRQLLADPSARSREAQQTQSARPAQRYSDRPASRSWRSRRPSWGLSSG